MADPSSSNTDFTNLERRLTASEERLRALFTSLPVGLVIVNSDGKIESVSPALCRLLEFEAKELARKPIEVLFNQMPTFAHEEPGVTAQVEAISKQQELIPVEVTQIPFLLQDKEITLFMLVDISERVKAQQMKSELVAMVTHDLRTPIGAVSLFLDLLLDESYGTLNEKGQLRLHQVQENLGRILHLINEMLEIDRLESGFVLNLEAVPLLELIDSALSLVAELAEARSISIAVQSPDILVEGDKELLIRLIMNLVSNAIKFSPPDSKVEISAVQQPNYLELRIRDSGSGIKPQDKPALFHRYKQGSARSDIRKTGFGLGLAVCKAIVQLHGGQIGVDSEEGHGSEFWFRLPKVAKLQ